MKDIDKIVDKVMQSKQSSDRAGKEKEKEKEGGQKWKNEQTRRTWQIELRMGRVIDVDASGNGPELKQSRKWKEERAGASKSKC